MTKNEWISIAKILVFIRIQLQFVREVDISKTQKTPVMFRFTGVYILVPRRGVEPLIPPWKGGVLTDWPTRRSYKPFYWFSVKGVQRYRRFENRPNFLTLIGPWARWPKANHKTVPCDGLYLQIKPSHLHQKSTFCCSPPQNPHIMPNRIFPPPSNWL